jgi:hypothetical protein
VKRISFYAGRNRSGNQLHIETDGAIVNVRVGLHDTDGRRVTSVQVSPDNYAERGGHWVLDGSRVVQLLDGETQLPEPTVVTVGWGQEQRNIALLALHRMAFSLTGTPGVTDSMRETAMAAWRALEHSAATS